MTFKPMLAFSKLPDFRLLKFPLYVSTKLDGIRASMQDGQLVSRSLKPIPNKFVQEMFAGLPEGVDGELIQGSPTDEPFRRTTSIVMSDDKPADGIKLYAFDKYIPKYGFQERFGYLRDVAEGLPHVIIVPHVLVNSIDELETAEQEFLGAGYEGLMIRSLSGPYKQGRSTESEGYLLKVKRFEDGEARVIGTYEEMENQNASFTNELGRTARSSHKAGKVGKNRLGGFHVRGMLGSSARYAGVEFDVASGAIDHATRETLWQDRGALIGQIVSYKFFPKGGDEKPRHPIFRGIRDARDLS